jgi:hypothetical protein
VARREREKTATAALARDLRQFRRMAGNVLVWTITGQWFDSD